MKIYVIKLYYNQHNIEILYITHFITVIIINGENLFEIFKFLSPVK